MIDIALGLILASVTTNAYLGHRCHKLEQIANQCPLTKLRSKHAYQTRKAYKEETFIFIDVCFLKLHNDNRSHSEGDRYLADIGAFIKTHIRHKDAYRLSGDELLITIKGDDKAALDVVERLQAELLKAKDNGILAGHHDENDHPVELAMGIGQTIECADTAMYEHKETIHKAYGNYKR